jgi:hypothetical protein
MPRPTKNRPVDLGSLRGRLQFIRGSEKQSDFASKIGIRRERYASYEVERVPLKFLAGWEICRICGINQMWLATGKGGREGYLSLIDNLKDLGIDDRTTFEEGVVALWPQLTQAAIQNGIPTNAIPPHPPEPVHLPEPGVSFRAVRQVAKGRIKISATNIAEMKLTVPAEYLPGAKPVDGPDVVVLVHPGFEAVAEFLMPHRPRNASVHLLRRCLAGDFRSESLLNRLDPRFLIELMLAAQELTGITC